MECNGLLRKWLQDDFLFFKDLKNGGGYLPLAGTENFLTAMEVNMALIKRTFKMDDNGNFSSADEYETMISEFFEGVGTVKLLDKEDGHVNLKTLQAEKCTVSWEVFPLKDQDGAFLKKMECFKEI